MAVHRLRGRCSDTVREPRSAEEEEKQRLRRWPDSINGPELDLKHNFTRTEHHQVRRAYLGTPGHVSTPAGLTCPRTATNVSLARSFKRGLRAGSNSWPANAKLS